MMGLCRACGDVTATLGDCPYCGSASVYEAAWCPVCREAREAKDLLCDRCAQDLRTNFTLWLRALTPAERQYLDLALEGRGLEEFL